MTREETMTVKSGDADETVVFHIERSNLGAVKVTVTNRDTDMSAVIDWQDFQAMFFAVQTRLCSWHVEEEKESES